MKYAVYYRNDFRHFDSVDEVIFEVTKGDESILTTLPNIVKETEQKITFDLYQLESAKFEQAIKFINQLKEIHNNILVQIRYPFINEQVMILKDNKLPFMASHCFCSNLDTVYALTNVGVSEVYVAEELGFRLPEVNKITKPNNVKVRVFPNVTQCSYGTKNLIPPACKFWIRPEDTIWYEDLVDTFELFDVGNRLSVIYEIYRQKVWDGSISDIIIDAESLKGVDSNAIPPHFGEQRAKGCRQSCLYGGCGVCLASIQFAEAFTKTENQITYPREKIARKANEPESND